MKTRTLALVILLCLVAAACQSAPPAPSANPPSGDILIASDLPTSGEAASLTMPLQQAIQLAIDQHPTIGQYRLAYWSLDDELAGTPNQAKGRENVKRMIGTPRVLGMIGPYTSNVAFAEIPEANSAQLVMLSPTNTDPCLTQPAPCDQQPITLRPSGLNNYFRTAAPDTVQGRAMAKYVTRTLNVQRVAAFNEWGPNGGLILDSFAKELALTGGELVLRRELVAGTSDFGDFLAAASTNGAQAIYALGQADQGICAARAQMTSKLFPGGAYFLATDGVTGVDKCIKDAADNATAMYATLPDVDATLSTDAAAAKVVADYRKAFPKTPPTAGYMFSAYDCALILIEAITRAVQANGGAIPTRQQVVDEVAHGVFKDGATGTYSFDSNGDAISPLMSMYAVQNNQWVYLERIDASS